MTSSYKGTENNEQPKHLLLTVNTNQGIMAINIKGVFRTETALIDQALRKDTLLATVTTPLSWLSLALTRKMARQLSCGAGTADAN